jgi:hypothetical protein
VATSQAKVSQATEYIILRRAEVRDPETDQQVVAWIEDGTASRTSRADAVKEAVGDREGVWRPVPVRNWQKPIRTRTETQKRTVVEDVDDEPAGPAV